VLAEGLAKQKFDLLLVETKRRIRLPRVRLALVNIALVVASILLVGSLGYVFFHQADSNHASLHEDLESIDHKIVQERDERKTDTREIHAEIKTLIMGVGAQAPIGPADARKVGAKKVTNLIDQLIRDEGVSLKPYLDQTGHVTIGVGRNLTDVGVDKVTTGLMLRQDIDNVRSQLVTLGWYAKANSARQGAAENLAFAMGVHGFLSQTSIVHAYERQDWFSAVTALSETKWCVVVTVRCTRLMKQIETGEWQ